MASGTSKETELKLTNVARASLEELLADYQDVLPSPPAVFRVDLRWQTAHHDSGLAASRPLFSERRWRFIARKIGQSFRVFSD